MEATAPGERLELPPLAGSTKISSRGSATPTLPPVPHRAARSRALLSRSTCVLHFSGDGPGSLSPASEIGMAALRSSTVSATATTAGPSSSSLLATTFRRGRLLPRGAPPRRVFAARAEAQPLEVCAKASVTVPGRLGDCPFTQRVLLTIEEKHLPYDLKLVDLANKPDWLFELNPEGKVPIVKLENKWVADSDVITQAIEEKYPEPSLITPPDKALIGSKIFSTFIGFLKSKDPSDGTEQALLDELTSFDSYLKDNGPFINGGTISAADLSLGPKLYHMEIALGHYKNWSVPDSLPHVKAYMKSIFSMDSFVKTRALTEDIIAGWRPKVMG